MEIVPVYRRWGNSDNSLLFCLVVLKGNVKSQISGFLFNYSVEIVVYLDVHLLSVIRLFASFGFNIAETQQKHAHR